MLVKELMKDPYVINKNISLVEAAKIMSSKNIGCLVLVSGRTIKGIITERDLLKNFSKNAKVEEIMTTKVVTIGPKDDLQKALDLMNRYKIKKLPVAEGKELVGIITSTDLIECVDELEGDFFFR